MHYFCFFASFGHFGIKDSCGWQSPFYSNSIWHQLIIGNNFIWPFAPAKNKLPEFDIGWTHEHPDSSFLKTWLRTNFYQEEPVWTNRDPCHDFFKPNIIYSYHSIPTQTNHYSKTPISNYLGDWFSKINYTRLLEWLISITNTIICFKILKL